MYDNMLFASDIMRASIHRHNTTSYITSMMWIRGTEKIFPVSAWSWSWIFLTGLCQVTCNFAYGYVEANLLGIVNKSNCLLVMVEALYFAHENTLRLQFIEEEQKETSHAYAYGCRSGYVWGCINTCKCIYQRIVPYLFIY